MNGGVHLSVQTTPELQANYSNRYIVESKSSNTKRAYASDAAHFDQWCRGEGVPSLPATAETVCRYLEAQATKYKVATVQRRVAAISQGHQLAGTENPTMDAKVRATMRGIKRVHGPEQLVKRAVPAKIGAIRKMLATPPMTDTLIDHRDRALLLIGFAGAFRRSELVELRTTDVTETESGLRVMVRKSKTDQEGDGYVKGLPFGRDEDTCPVRALRRWLVESGVTDGPIFRSVTRGGDVGTGLSDRAVDKIIRKRATMAGLDNAANYSGHSLRAGFATTAAEAGVSERLIAKQTGHKSMIVLRGYIREGSLFQDNAADKVGL